MEPLIQPLFKQTDARRICLFRLLFGLAMLYQMLYYFRIDYVHQFMTGPQMSFGYPALSWLPQLPEGTLRILLVAMTISVIALTAGLFTRIAALVFTIIFTYSYLVDQTLFNNHLYLFSLIGLVFVFVRSDRYYAISRLWRKTGQGLKTVPRWHLWLLRFTVLLPFFFGGLAKLNADWLSGRIPQIIVSNMPKQSALYSLFNSDFGVSFIAYGGMLFDLLIGPLLLWKRTRMYAIGAAILFNITNGSWLFDDIGVFPMTMIGALVLFVPLSFFNLFGSRSPKQKTQKRKKAIPRTAHSMILRPKHYWITAALLLFVVIQAFFPIRAHVASYNAEWTGIASHFAWRMKMQTRKLVDFKMSVGQPSDAQPMEVDYQSFLTTNQQKHLLEDPFYIVQLAQHIALQARERGMHNPEVRADVRVLFNGRPAQSMINPNIDLTTITWKDRQDIDRWVPRLRPI